MPAAPPPLPSPKSLLHYVSFFCLVGWGVSAIVVVSHVGTHAPWFEATRQLTLQFFFGLLAFGLFYIQQTLVERYARQELGLPLGYIQVFGGLGLLMLGVSITFTAILANAPPSGPARLSDNTLFYICVLGEGIFLVNVVKTYFLKERLPPGRQAVPATRPVPQTRATSTTSAIFQKIAAQLNWSSSPAAIFGIAGGFFIAAGIIIISAVSTRVPVFSDGSIFFISPGYLWIPLAAPFALFALVYWAIEYVKGWKFDRSATRIHFLCTILAVIECIRIYASWSTTVGNRQQEFLTTRDFYGVFAFLALAAGALVWNICASARRTARPE